MPAQAIAYSYLRFSTPDQLKGDSLRRQVDKTAAWCRSHDVKLDEEHKLQDLGVSAFSGDHRSKENADRYALAGFLEMVKRGVVAKGSLLIVERLDRLTREAIRPALTMILNLIEAGVVIVQLEPETILDHTADEYRLLTVIMELRRGNSESQAKRDRNGEAWSQKREEARTQKTLLTGKVPFWLRIVGRTKVGNRVVGGKVNVVDEKAELVRRIFGMSLEGRGIYEIAKTLNFEGVKHNKSHWRTSHVAYLLANRSVLGEFQPMTGKHPNRKPAGLPLIDYFPRVVEDKVFYAVREGLDDRRHKKPGRPGKESTNLFSGLLNDGRTGGKVNYATTGLANSGIKLVAANALDVLPGSKFISFPAGLFEAEILKEMSEVNVSDLLPSQEVNFLSELAGKLTDVETRRDKIKARLKANPDSDSLYEVLSQLDGEVKALAADLAAERQRTAGGAIGEAWGEVQSLAAVAADSDHDARRRMRTAIRRVVDSVWCVFVGRTASEKSAVVQVFFKGGSVRTYGIIHKFKHKTRGPITLTLNFKSEATGANLRDIAETDRDALVDIYLLGLEAFRERICAK